MITPALPKRRPGLRILLLAAAVAVAPLPATAGTSPPQPAGAATLQAQAQAIVAAQVVGAKPRAARSSSASQADPSSGSFFKSPVGIVVLATLAVGVGYALYSTQNDRITSPAKQ